MGRVKYINKDKSDKGVVFKSYADSGGFFKDVRQPHTKDELFYLGKDTHGEDVFLDYDSEGSVCIFFGDLNSGNY